MDIVRKEEDLSLHQVVLYASISFLIVSLLGIFLYITCSKKYKLNWFEKNLLETANENQELNQRYYNSLIKNCFSTNKVNNEIFVYSNEALVCNSIPYNVDSMDAGSVRSLNRSPVSANDDPTFWVPQVQRQVSACPSGGTGSEAVVTSADESLPATPTSPTGSHNSMALSISSGTVPIARTDKHIVLSMSPARPKVSSMQAKLDHTKIDTSLYDNVR